MKESINRVITFAALVAMFALVPGCVSTGTNFDASKVSQIKKGETTEDHLEKLFGKPKIHTVSSEGITHLTWSYLESQMKGESFIPIAGPFVGGSRSSHKTLSVTLGPDGRVTHFTSSSGGSEMRYTTQDAPKQKGESH